MTDTEKTALRASTSLVEPDTASVGRRKDALNAFALITAGALAFWPIAGAASDDTPSGLKPAGEVKDDLAPDDYVEEGLDVDDIREEADVPDEGAEPNAVVPQNALIPPASIKDEADQ